MEIYPGLNSFREWFKGHENSYVIIGGVASSLLLRHRDVDTLIRTTRDLDVVLLVESMTPEFGRIFFVYVKAAGYSHRLKSGKNEFYRFHSPKSNDYPRIIELFSRQIEGLPLPSDAIITPLPTGDDISSLSAILLDDDYYRFLHTGIRRIGDLPVIAESHIIPFKAKAWLELTEIRSRDASLIHANDISKHFRDIFNHLVVLLPQDYAFVQVLPKSIESDLCRFILETGKLRDRKGNVFENDSHWQRKANVLIASYGLPLYSTPWKLPISVRLIVANREMERQKSNGKIRARNDPELE